MPHCAVPFRRSAACLRSTHLLIAPPCTQADSPPWAVLGPPPPPSETPPCKTQLAACVPYAQLSLSVCPSKSLDSSARELRCAPVRPRGHAAPAGSLRLPFCSPQQRPSPVFQASVLGRLCLLHVPSASHPKHPPPLLPSKPPSTPTLHFASPHDVFTARLGTLCIFQRLFIPPFSASASPALNDPICNCHIE